MFIKSLEKIFLEGNKQYITDLKLACVAWRFRLGALNNKGGRGQRNREEIGTRLGREQRAPDKTAMLHREI